jgi:hypothetical protein
VERESPFTNMPQYMLIIDCFAIVGLFVALSSSLIFSLFLSTTLKQSPAYEPEIQFDSYYLNFPPSTEES